MPAPPSVATARAQYLDMDIEPAEAVTDRTIDGRLVGVTGQVVLSGVSVWLAWDPEGGEVQSVETVTSADGEFSFVLPDGPITRGRIGVTGADAVPLDLDVQDGELLGGEAILMMGEVLPSHLRFGGA